MCRYRALPNVIPEVLVWTIAQFNDAHREPRRNHAAQPLRTGPQTHGQVWRAIRRGCRRQLPPSAGRVTAMHPLMYDSAALARRAELTRQADRHRLVTAASRAGDPALQPRPSLLIRWRRLVRVTTRRERAAALQTSG